MHDEFQTQQYWRNMKKTELKQIIKEEFEKLNTERIPFDTIDGYATQSEENYKDVEKAILIDSGFYEEEGEPGFMGDSERTDLQDLVSHLGTYGMDKNKAKEFIEKEAYKNEALKTDIEKYVEENP